MTIPIYGAAELREAVRFTQLIEPLRVAFGEFSHGRAQQVMSAFGHADLIAVDSRLRRGCHTHVVRTT